MVRNPYQNAMEFVELPIFTRRIQGHLSDDDLRALQGLLFERPRAGAVIPGSGGLRKIRVPMAGRGKRGGGRVIYYFVDEKDRIYLLFFYRKAERADLTPAQLRTLRRLVENR